MAIVANGLPFDTLTVGKRVVWYDPGFTVAGRNTGTITKVTWGVASGDTEVTIDVRKDGAGADITAQNPTFFRVIDKQEKGRPNV